ncbi:hypothetical protein [Halomonas sp. Y3]|uniref:hypothetical protein n=1 Tax=Halomonas sp. Y3 TaxID=2956797 RepID=UPI00209FA58D|nr:hypothetical protein [Halomonas sp. Y3]
MFEELEQFSVRGKLTPKIISKNILPHVVSGTSPSKVLVEKLNIENDIIRLSKIYRSYQEPSDMDEGSPRYLPFYRYIKTKFPEFGWKVMMRNEKPMVILDLPYIDHREPSLLKLLISAMNGNTETTPALAIRYPRLSELPTGLVADIELVFKDLSVSYCAKHFIDAFTQSIQAGLNGKEVTLVSPVCPDYGYEKKEGKYRYTFEELGDGIGLVAQRVVRALPKLMEVLVRHGIKTNVAVAAGDFEGFDSATLQRVSETHETFRAKIVSSQSRILKALGGNAESIMISDEVGGEKSWERLVNEAKGRLKEGDYGSIEIGDVNIHEILDSRIPLYREWHVGKDRNQLLDILLQQAAEYSVMGKLFSERWGNPIVIGADHNMMQPFYWLYKKIPVVYLSRVY